MKKSFIILVISILYIQNISAQSAWTREKGGFYGKFGFYNVSGSEYYNTEGKPSVSNTFTQQAFALYGEYGITKNINAIVNFPFLKFNKYNVTETVAGIGNPQIEFKFAILKKIPVVALSVGAEIPFANQTNLAFYKEVNTTLGIKEFINLPAGTPDFNYWGTISVSSGLGSVPGWVSAFFQYNVRTQNFSDRLKYGFEVGYKWSPKFWTNVRLVSLTNGKDKENVPVGGIINGQRTEFGSLGVGAAYEVAKHWSVTLDYQTFANFLVQPKNVYTAPFFQVGVSAEF